MLRQVALERDLTGRWNRLTQGTPWQIEWVCDDPQAATRRDSVYTLSS